MYSNEIQRSEIKSAKLSLVNTKKPFLNKKRQIRLMSIKDSWMRDPRCKHEYLDNTQSLSVEEMEMIKVTNIYKHKIVDTCAKQKTPKLKSINVTLPKYATLQQISVFRNVMHYSLFFCIALFGKVT